MSADLFAEFGNGASTSQTSRAARQQPVASQAGSLIPGLIVFEDAILSQSSPSHLNAPAQLSARAKSHSQTLQFDDFGDFEQPQANDNDVLFDATLERFSDDNDDDDWGEFESAEFPGHQFGQTQAQQLAEQQKTVNQLPTKALQSSKSQSRPSGTVNLLDSLDSLTFQDKPTASSRQASSTLIDDSPTMKGGNVRQTKPALPVEEEPFEEWGDFTDGPIKIPESKVTNAQRAPSNKESLTQATEATSNTGGARPAPQARPVSKSAAHVRPTNIPPPSILLELFSRLFERLRQDGTEAKKNLQERETLVSVSSSIILTLKAVARVVAGRTLRWKRDSILSQSMRIGPARSGKAGGMKLNTVNKNEDIKEKQEAVDVLNMWRDRAAVFNSVIQAAGRRPVQAILENTRVTTATASQGAIKASHACALCGLKRDERLPKIDENVEDSFGEWWTEHWGHTECRLFWEDNMGLLGQR
ncbi:uncharacterized protein BDV17DRAFT_182434 [Aspergillus undulatus]|uniref:uncharacterized protein n=1 Tax=Aspergillus undulatus TaxID=1810928 RepID=UPI003CCCDEF2